MFNKTIQLVNIIINESVFNIKEQLCRLIYLTVLQFVHSTNSVRAEMLLVFLSEINSDMDGLGLHLPST